MSTRRYNLDRGDMSMAIQDLNAIPVTLVDAATIAIDPKAGDYFVIPLGASRILGAAASPYREGGTYTFEVRQTGAGSFTLTWPAAFDWGTTGAPTLTTTTGKSDIVRGNFRNGVMRMALVAKGFN